MMLFVELAATPETIAKTQAQRDSKRVKNAAKRAMNDVGSRFPGNLDSLLQRSWHLGELLGNSAARKQAKAAKLDKPKAVKSDPRILKSLKRDLARIKKEAKGLKEGETGWDGLRLRAKMVMEAAVKMSAASAFEDALSEDDWAKMWVVTSAKPCTHCVNLDGKVFPLKKKVPEKFLILKPYTAELFSPPLHPNCGCMLVPVPLHDNISV